MAWTTLVTAAALIITGLAGYLAQDPNAGKVSPTALIPAAFGVVLGICGLLAFKPGLRKHVMHLAAVIALIGALGAPYPIIKRLLKGSDIGFHEPAVISAFVTTLLCLLFLAMCVNSFVQARRARQRSATPPPDSYY
jgi:hypothetical protein